MAEKTKVHWTQTPAGRKRMARIQRLAIKARKQKGAGHDHDTAEDRHVSYIYGCIETRINIYADSLGIPAAILANRVGQLLLRSSRRKELGA